jgi:Domain of unknown function (DUF4868)
MARMWGYAVEIYNASGRVICFRKFTESKLIGKTDDKGKWLGKISEGLVIEMKEEVLTFDQHIDGVFFKTLDSILVAPPHYIFEEMFSLRTFYENEYKKVIDHLRKKSLLEFDEEGIISESQCKIRLIRKISELSLDGFFKRMEKGDITMYFFETTKQQIGTKIMYEVAGNKIRIPNGDALAAFVDVCAEKYVRSMAGYRKGMDPRIFMAEYKEPLT